MLVTASSAGSSSAGPSNYANRTYSQSLSANTVEVLRNQSSSTPDPNNHKGFRHRFPAIRVRTLAPLPSPLEYIVPYTPKTTLIPPVVSEHLNPKLASTTSVYVKKDKGCWVRVVNKLVSTFRPPTSGKHARLEKSTQVEIVNYIANQHSLSAHAGTTDMRYAKQIADERRRSMLVFDVFTTEDRTLRAFAIGSCPEEPIYIYYPLRHPYDELLLETLANRSAPDYLFPYIPESDGPDDDVNNTSDEGETKKQTRNFWGKGKQKQISISTPKPASTPPGPVFTIPLSQAFLEFRDPLEGFRSEIVSGLRWSSLWINNQFKNCVDPVEEEVLPLIIPTEEEVNAVITRGIHIADFETRLATISGFERWLYKRLHEKAVYKPISITGGLTESQRRKLAQPHVLRSSKDAGAIFVSPHVTVPEDPRIANYLLPALTAAKNSQKAGNNSKISIGTSQSISASEDAAFAEKVPVFMMENAQSNIGNPTKKHPIAHRAAPKVSATRRPATVYDLSAIIQEEGMGLPQFTSLDYHSEYVIAEEYTTFSADPDPSSGRGATGTVEAGIQIFYEPPVARSKKDIKKSDAEYISGKYMWVHERVSWVIVYERRKPGLWQKRERRKREEAEKKEREKAKSAASVIDWRAKAKNVEDRAKHPNVPPRNFGRVKLYPPAGSRNELLAYLDLEKGQLSVRQDVTIEDLHLAVLAILSVVNIEEALQEEVKARKQLNKNEHLDLDVAKEPPAMPVPVESSSKGKGRAPSIGQLEEKETAIEMQALGGGTAEREEDMDDDASDSENDVQEIVRRTSKGWVRRSRLMVPPVGLYDDGKHNSD